MCDAARYGVFAVAGLNVAMAIILSHSFLTHDFANKYVTAYSDRSMPTIYLLASFWGGEKGALLFWTTSLSVFSGIAIHRIVNGFPRMTSPLKENSSTSVTSRAMIVIGVRMWRKRSSNQMRPLLAMSHVRDRKPATNGSAT